MTSRYTIMRELTKSDVYVCYDHYRGQEVVIKRTITSMNDVDMETRIYHMLHAAGGHPYILPLLDYFHENEFIGLVMEYCPNGDLFDLVFENKCIGSHESIVYFEQLASAISALHSIGYAHGDISLENVLLGKNMQVQLMDFGEAIPIHLPTTEIGGKCNYMAPELFSGLPWDPAAADVWALAMTFFAMLTGDFLLDESVVGDPIFQILMHYGFRGVLNHMPQWKALIPEIVIPIFEQMLQIDPRMRASMSSVLRYANLLTTFLSASTQNKPHGHSPDKRHKIMRPRTLYRHNDIYARPSSSASPAFVHCA